MAYAGAGFWDQYFRGLRQSGDDLDWEGLWTRSFLAPLRQAGTRTILKLGCGTGNDAARLACEGYSVTAIEVSAEAIERASARFGPGRQVPRRRDSHAAALPGQQLRRGDVQRRLTHVPDRVTRPVFAEIRRLVRPGGLFLFHVNAVEDRPLRARWRPVARELEQDFVPEETGQTMHFFSEAYLRELLQDWAELRLDPVEITRDETGEKFKHVWRGIALR